MPWTYHIGAILPQDDTLVAVPTQPGQKLKWALDTTKRFVIDGEARDGVTTVPLTIIIDCRANMATLSMKGATPPVFEFYIACVKNMVMTAGVGGRNDGFFDVTNQPQGQTLTAQARDPVHLAGVFHRLRELNGFS